MFVFLEMTTVMLIHRRSLGSTRSVSLAWTAVASATGYVVEKSATTTATITGFTTAVPTT